MYDTVNFAVGEFRSKDILLLVNFVKMMIISPEPVISDIFKFYFSFGYIPLHKKIIRIIVS